MNSFVDARVALITLCIAAVSFGVPASAQSSTDLEPAAPADAVVVTEVQAGGAQIYACRRLANAFAWTLVGPEAILVNGDGTNFGTHTAGPAWTALDGSSVVADGAHPLVKLERPGAVPALLLSVVSRTGTGVLTPVRFVRRADTEGGRAPDGGCDAAHAGTTVARHYSAIYTFYR